MARIKSDSSNIAFQTIKDQINRFDLKPGDTVSDLAFANELNMSRTPVREAMQVLVKTGLIVKERTKYTVAPITYKDVEEILLIRAALEKSAVDQILSTGGLDDEQLNDLYRLADTIKDNIENFDYIESFYNDSSFHTKIVSLCNNERLLQFMNDISIQGERLRWLSVLTPDRGDNTISEHYLILDSLKNKDKIECERSIDLHIHNTLVNYQRLLENENWTEKIISLKKIASA